MCALLIAYRSCYLSLRGQLAGEGLVEEGLFEGVEYPELLIVQCCCTLIAFKKHIQLVADLYLLFNYLGNLNFDIAHVISIEGWNAGSTCILVESKPLKKMVNEPW